MRIRILFATLTSLLLVCPLHAQPVDKAKLDRFLDHLSEKNQGMGALTIVLDGKVATAGRARVHAGAVAGSSALNVMCV